MKCKILPFFIIILISVFQTNSQSSKFEKHIFDKGADFKLPYRFFIPENIQEDKKYPLLLFLHGAGEWGDDNDIQLRHFPSIFIDSTNSANNPCYILVPQCTESSPWSSFPQYPGVYTPAEPTKSTAQVLSLIDTLLHSDSLQIDPDRVYVTGYSLGGEGTFDIIARAPDLFAAAIPICGIADTAKAQLMVNTPLWIFLGSEDDINDVNYSRIIVDALEKIGKPPKYTEYEGGGHYIWGAAYSEPELLPWLFSQYKGKQNHVKKGWQIQNKEPVSAIKSSRIILLTWKQPANPDVVDMFSLDGRSMKKYKVTSVGCLVKRERVNK